MSMRRWKTRTRPNHIDQERETVWGWDAIAAVTGLASLGITVIGVLLTLGAHFDERMSAFDLRLSAAEHGGGFTKEQLDRLAISEAADHADFVRRSEYEHHNHGGKVPPEGGRQ